jgi:hypothetical protein
LNYLPIASVPLSKIGTELFNRSRIVDTSAFAKTYERALEFSHYTTQVVLNAANLRLPYYDAVDMYSIPAPVRKPVFQLNMPILGYNYGEEWTVATFDMLVGTVGGIYAMLWALWVFATADFV